MNRTIIYCLISLSCITAAYLEQQKFAIEPENITVILGETVVLPCRVVDKQGILQWTKDDFGLGAHRNLTAFDRYTMVGNDESGDYSLQIDGVTLDDDARFQCQVSPGPNGQPGIRSRFAKLTVLVPPQPPVITQGDFLLATEGQETYIECVSKGGKPEAEIFWIDGSGNIITNRIDYTSDPMADGKTFLVRSVLKLLPQRKHHDTILTCQSQNIADRQFKTAEIKIEVRYAPKITLLLVPDETQTDDTVLENTEAKFRCEVDANPSDISYKWFINNNLIIGDYTTEMVLHNVNRTHHKAIIKCEATNDVGVTEESLPLNIKYPPVIKHHTGSIDADERKVVTLTCDADGNPVEIVWLYDPIDKLNFQPEVISITNNVEITVSNKSVGRYFCKASVAGFPEVKAETNVYMKQPPIIESPRTQYGSKGDTLRLECAALSVPKARHISWSFNGHEINPVADRDYSILDDPSPRRIKSTLIIQDSQDWHFGKYNCTVVNDYGADVLQIDLVQQNNFQFLMIIVGATSGVVILVIIVVLFLCIKLRGKVDNRSRKEKELSAEVITNKTIINDQCCPEGDESSHSSEYKPDIKAGSSESDYSIASTNFVESTIDAQEVRGGSVPLAGPIDFPVNYRNSADYADANRYYPPKYAYGNYGYETHTDYARYCLAPAQRYPSRTVLPPSTNSDNYHYSRSNAGHADIGHIGNSGDAIISLRQDNGLPVRTRSSLIV